MATGPQLLKPPEGYAPAGSGSAQPSDAEENKEPPPRGGVQLDLNGFEGLLELARRHAVDVAAISAIDLVDQFLAATDDLTSASFP
jgi:hypothetical protein